MTVKEYQYYSKMTTNLFNFMNGYVNKINSNCLLCINMYDLVNETYGNIRHPKMVYINVGNIVDSWNEDWEGIVDRHDFIGTILAWTICHELYHADQELSMIKYAKDDSYKKSSENDVEVESYYWVLNHADEVSEVGGFNVVIDCFTTGSFNFRACRYKSINAKSFYTQTIANIVLRNFDMFNKIDPLVNDSNIDDITLVFGNVDSVDIKKNGEYLDENINTFSSYVYKWASYFDNYIVSVEGYYTRTPNNKPGVILSFEFKDRSIYPIIYKQ